MAHCTASNINANSDRADGPPGAPKASYVKEVLVTLRDRLEAQVNGANDRGPAMVRNLRAHVRDQLKQINVALVQIDEGKYGICANCLMSIAADRLVARPYSTLCTECQDRLERGELEPD